MLASGPVPVSSEVTYAQSPGQKWRYYNALQLHTYRSNDAEILSQASKYTALELNIDGTI
jgi:hypothetical protein